MRSRSACNHARDDILALLLGLQHLYVSCREELEELLRRHRKAGALLERAARDYEATGKKTEECQIFRV